MYLSGNLYCALHLRPSGTLAGVFGLIRQFRQIQIDDRDRLTPALAHFRFVDLGFSALYYCAQAFDIEYCFFGSTLCLRILNETGGYAYALSSLERLEEIVSALFQEEERDMLHFDFVEEKDLDSYRRLSNYHCEIGFEEKYSDYLCTYADYISVDKKASPHKYKDYSRFIKNHQHETSPMDASNLSVAAELLERWCAGRDCAACTTGCEKQWILRLLDAWNSLNVKGVIVKANGSPAAFCILEQNGDTVMRLVGKSPDRILGLQIFMGVESAKVLCPDAKYVNLGSDSGVPGIRQFKDKFRPYTKLNKYSVLLTPLC